MRREEEEREDAMGFPAPSLWSPLAGCCCYGNNSLRALAPPPLRGDRLGWRWLIKFQKHPQPSACKAWVAACAHQSQLLGVGVLGRLHLRWPLKSTTAVLSVS
ncbi:rCG32116 [Rattus norvegicus]|uniref:RCG32116 n=1 Tax=Rattus norvegicus TaxID=10116 RepID=A6JWV2_RAT|nr:rCG32116 [Rattus norvegicus]